LLIHPNIPGTISPADLKKPRRCGSFDFNGPIIYQRLWFNSNKQFRASKFVFKLSHSRCDFLESLWFPSSDLRTENIRRNVRPTYPKIAGSSPFTNYNTQNTKTAKSCFQWLFPFSLILPLLGWGWYSSQTPNSYILINVSSFSHCCHVLTGTLSAVSSFSLTPSLFLIVELSFLLSQLSFPLS
jgi:hypothetical protein